MWRADAVLLLSGSDTAALVRRAIDGARARLWVTQFTVDARPERDRPPLVRYVLHALANARRRGVDVRVMLPVVIAPAGPPYDINEPAARFLTARGVAVSRYAASAARPHCHAKTLVADDDIVIAGNVNWTRGAFRRNTELGVAVRSVGLAASVAGRFDSLWARALEKDGPPVSAPVARCAEERWREYLAEADPHQSGRERGRELQGELMGHLSSDARVQPLAGQRYVRTIARLVATATRRVWVSMLGLRASTERRLRILLDSLAAARGRGVDVRVLYEVRDGPLTDWTADIGPLRSLGVPTRPWPLRSEMHLRSILVDDEHTIVGSVGWTPQSVFVTEELSVHVHGSRVAGAFAEQFARWWETRLEPTPPSSTVDMPTLTPSSGCGCTGPPAPATLAASVASTQETVPAKPSPDARKERA